LKKLVVGVSVKSGIDAMEDDDEYEDNPEVNAKLDFVNEIADEPLTPPPKRFRRIRELSFGVVALLLVLVAIINLAMILWFLLR
jgi:hypothetical protein